MGAIPTAEESTPLRQALRSMLEGKETLIAVVDGQRKLVGVVDRADILRGLAAPGYERPMLSKILVGVDGSSPSQRAFAVALDLAKHYRAPLHVCSVIEDVPKYDGESIAFVEEAVERAQKAFDRVYESLAGRPSARMSSSSGT